MRVHWKITFRTLVFLFFLKAASVLLFSNLYSQNNPIATEKPKAKVHVLLLSSWRSGSSFFGQIFGRHPSVFYLMEPGWHVWTKVKNSGAKVLRMAVRDLLRSVYQCDFSVMDAYMWEKRRLGSLFMWYQSRALCSPPACFHTDNKTQCSPKCGAENFEKVEEACHTYSHVVLKEVRIFELESLYSLLQDPNLNLRIIHLVRDPRAVMRSREESAASFYKDNAIILEQKNITKAQEQYRVMKEICDSHLRIYKSAMVEPPDFLQGRYKLVRYEDVIRNPLKEVNDMYEFVDLEMTRDLGKWIYNMTHGRGKGNWLDAFKVMSRDAFEVSQAWRTTLPHKTVKGIQQVCKEAMSLLKYRPVNSESEQKRLYLDLLSPQKPYRFAWQVERGKNENSAL